MSNLQQDITESIKTGEYFEDAKQWYGLKYLHPITHRSFLLVVTGLSVVLAFVAIRVFLSFLPLVEVVPIVIDIPSKAEQYSRLNSIGKITEDPNESLIKYLVVRYIEARESYNYNSVREGHKLKYLKDFSSREVFDNYKAEISFDNPESPILLYKKNKQRFIELLDVRILKTTQKIESGIQKIAAKFRANVVGRGDIKSSIWLARMEVDYETAEYAREIKKFSPLHLKVNYYEVSKLGDE